MDYPINELRERMSATLDLHRDLGQPEDVYIDEIEANVISCIGGL